MVRRTLRRSFIVLIVVAGTLAVPATAVADGALTVSDPPDQAVLTTAPAVVELTFSATPDLGVSHVAVLDETGVPVNTAPLAAGSEWTLRQPVAIRTPGDITVAYHVRLRGGGEASGSFRFSIGTGRAPAAIGGAAARAAAAVTDQHGHDIDPLSAVLLVINGAVVVGAALLLMLRPPRRMPRPAEPSLGLGRRRNVESGNAEHRNAESRRDA